MAACFVTDLGTVLALELIFAPFSLKTLAFLAVTPRFFRLYGDWPSELKAKFLLLCLLGMEALAGWADSEAVLPAYLIGMALAGMVGKDHALARRLRTLTFGLLTLFYFIRAGSFVSVPSLVAAPAAFLFFLLAKVATKIAGVHPVTKVFAAPDGEAMYNTAEVDRVTFGTIFSLFGLSHGIINQSQYSIQCSSPLSSAAPSFRRWLRMVPRHLLPRSEDEAGAPAEQTRFASGQAE